MASILLTFKPERLLRLLFKISFNEMHKKSVVQVLLLFNVILDPGLGIIELLEYRPLHLLRCVTYLYTISCLYCEIVFGMVCGIQTNILSTLL